MKEKSTHCVECGKSFSDVKFHAKSMCHKCYTKERIKIRSSKTHSRSEFNKCRMCGKEFNNDFYKSRNAAFGFCTNCYGKGKKQYDEVKVPTMLSNNDVSSLLTNDLIQSIKMILIRKNHSLETPVDFLKVLSIYTELYGVDIELDMYTNMAQNNFMIKCLEKLV